MEIFYQLERLTNALEVEKHKLNFPQYFKTDEINLQIKSLVDKIEIIKPQLNKVIGLEMKKDLMSMQLTEYIKKLDRNFPLPFSKSQGYIGNHHFYTKPLSDVKNILFNDFRGIMGVSLFLTKDNSDAVTDSENFKNLLFEIRSQIINSKSIYELYKICEKFIESIKKDFC